MLIWGLSSQNRKNLKQTTRQKIEHFTAKITFLRDPPSNLRLPQKCSEKYNPKEYFYVKNVRQCRQFSVQ